MEAQPILAIVDGKSIFFTYQYLEESDMVPNFAEITDPELTTELEDALAKHEAGFDGKVDYHGNHYAIDVAELPGKWVITVM